MVCRLVLVNTKHPRKTFNFQDKVEVMIFEDFCHPSNFYSWKWNSWQKPYSDYGSARNASDTCVRLTSKSVGWFCHLWDTCAQSTLAMIGRGSPGWHFTLFDRCNKVNAIRHLWSQNIWPWARLGRYFVPNKLHSWLRSWSFLWKFRLNFMSRK